MSANNPQSPRPIEEIRFDIDRNYEFYSFRLMSPDNSDINAGEVISLAFFNSVLNGIAEAELEYVEEGRVYGFRPYQTVVRPLELAREALEKNLEGARDQDLLLGWYDEMAGDTFRANKRIIRYIYFSLGKLPAMDEVTFADKVATGEIKVA